MVSTVILVLLTLNEVPRCYGVVTHTGLSVPSSSRMSLNWYRSNLLLSYGHLLHVHPSICKVTGGRVIPIVCMSSPLRTPVDSTVCLLLSDVSCQTKVLCLQMVWECPMLVI
ncbi:hypothetical protein EDC04DRAFT_2677707 [Pisolithus marmoratus]|nr:hypothetical protein EDC04DRAFT_2677707 [Pisolithus marmoratus]